MFFGEKKAPGIITGKSLAGYHTDEDSFDRPDQPMVRIWLDHVPEGGRPGDDKLTLEVDGDLYPRLEVARHGTAVWRGKRLLRFETESRAFFHPPWTRSLFFSPAVSWRAAIYWSGSAGTARKR